MGSLELKDIITGVGLILVICGWLFSRWKDRTHEIFKERLKKRLDMHDSVRDALMPFLNNKDGNIDLDKNELTDKLSLARTKVQLYGYKDEVEAYELFISQLKEKNLDGVNRSLRKIAPMMVSKLRKELGY